MFSILGILSATVETCKEIISLGAGVFGLLGFGFGLYQYYVAQKWKRSEFAAKHLELLASDAELALICKLLDWKRRDLQVPPNYRLLATSEVYEHNWEIFAEAMIDGRREGRYTWQQAMYRDLIDRFCEYLQTLNHYETIGLIDLRDIATVKYWLRQLASPRFANPGDKRMFIDFINFFEYPGVLELMAKFRLNQA